MWLPHRASRHLEWGVLEITVPAPLVFSGADPQSLIPMDAVCFGFTVSGCAGRVAVLVPGAFPVAVPTLNSPQSTGQGSTVGLLPVTQCLFSHCMFRMRKITQDGPRPHWTDGRCIWLRLHVGPDLDKQLIRLLEYIGT